MFVWLMTSCYKMVAVVQLATAIDAWCYKPEGMSCGVTELRP